MKSKKYRFSFDIGTNSIGWCVFSLTPEKEILDLEDLGARIYTDGRNPKDGTSLKVNRRLARQASRRRDRYLWRRERLMKRLIDYGLMPDDPVIRAGLAALDPYALRARGVVEQISPHELGRALYHLNQRRGFKSSRKPGGKPDDEEGKVKQGIKKLNELLGGKTLGQVFYELHKNRKAIRARIEGQGAKAAYPIYPARAMLEAEFDKIWANQAQFYPEILTAARRDILRHRIFDQRKLKPVHPGFCTLEPDQYRAPRALPIFQRFRILKELANLKYRTPGGEDAYLTRSQRDALAEKMSSAKEITFSAIRKALSLPADTKFNLESERRPSLEGDQTASRLAGKKSPLHKTWAKLSLNDQTEIVKILLEDEDEDSAVSRLMALTGLTHDDAETLAAISLPDFHASLSEKALGKLVPELESGIPKAKGRPSDAPIAEDEAIRNIYPDYNALGTGEILPRLPYYGEILQGHIVPGTNNTKDPIEKRIGYIANPTVHIGLNQLRIMVNSLIDRFGEPEQIIVELARDLKRTKKQKKEEEDRQRENQNRRKRHIDLLTTFGLLPKGDLLTRLRLWEMLDPTNRTCIYSGKPIGLSDLLSADNKIEIDHIIPFSISLDDSLSNRIVCFKEWNRLKRNKTPFGAFSDRSDWPEILQRAQALPKAWSWRFEPDALERFKQDSDFQARQLTDTQYLSRVARQYLNSVCGDVWVTPGRLTQMLRGRWGLNSLVGKGDDKDRHDHRHHALDAFVIGVTTRGLLHRISTAAGRAESGASNKLMDESPDPFEGFDRHKLSTLLDRTIIAHRMDHGTGGALHEETAYGIIPPAVQEDGYNLVFRKPLISLSMGEIDRIRDKTYRTKIKAAIESDLAAFDGDPSKFKLGPTLARMGEELNIRRIRLLKKDESVIPITGKTGRPYKALTPGDNHHVDFWAVPGKEKWVAIGLSLFEAARGGQTQRPHPAAKKVMTLHKGDLVEMDGPTGREVMRVCGLRVVNGILQLAGHRESGKLQQRHDDKNDPFTWTFISFNQVQAKNLRKIWVGPLGKKS